MLFTCYTLEWDDQWGPFQPQPSMNLWLSFFPLEIIKKTNKKKHFAISISMWFVVIHTLFPYFLSPSPRTIGLVLLLNTEMDLRAFSHDKAAVLPDAEIFHKFVFQAFLVPTSNWVAYHWLRQGSHLKETLEGGRTEETKARSCSVLAENPVFRICPHSS